MSYERLTQETIDEAIGDGCGNSVNRNDVIAFNHFTVHVFGAMAAEIQRWRLPVDVIVIGSEVLSAVRSDCKEGLYDRCDTCGRYSAMDIISIEDEFPERLYEGELDRRDPGYDGTFIGTVLNIPLYKNLGSWRPDSGEVYFFTEADFLFTGDGLNPRGLCKGIDIS
jgi:hypothetical protein